MQLLSAVPPSSSTLVSYADFGAAVAHARSIDLGAYILGAPTERLLETAARRGAHVKVWLSGEAFGRSADRVAAVQRQEIEHLRAAGVEASLTGDHAMHLKAASIDHVAYLATGNWRSSGEVLLRDTVPGDAERAMRAVRLGSAPAAPVAPGQLALSHAAALATEAALLSTDTKGTLRLATESLGPTAISRLVIERARHHQRVEVLLDRRLLHEDPAAQREADRFIAAGVDVRVSTNCPKLALTQHGGWIGSANATHSEPRMPDWGLSLSSPSELSALRRCFSARWSQATPIKSLPEATSCVHAGLRHDLTRRPIEQDG